MKNARLWAKPLLWLHLFVCAVWLCLFRSEGDAPIWMFHVFLLSLIGIQFTWGFTIGLLVGPSRKERQRLWWSLLLVFMPLWPVGMIIHGLIANGELMLALIYGSVFVAVIACETYGGVLLGAKTHSESKED